jgi:large subunit ribosomal protein L10e
MARIRKFVCYRTVERPFTRKSKYSKKNFVKVVPASKIQRFQVGDAARRFKYRFLVKSKSNIQLRHNALESARLTANKVLEKDLGKDNYFIKMRVFPHHILRENPLASGAGADRMSTGMAHSYGKNISSAAQLKAGQAVFEVDVDANGLKAGKLAAERMIHKFPCKCIVEIYDKETNKQIFV